MGSSALGTASNVSCSWDGNANNASLFGERFDGERCGSVCHHGRE